jgi:hypothetical protein
MTDHELPLLPIGYLEKLPISEGGLITTAIAAQARALSQLSGAELCELCGISPDSKGFETPP